MTETMLGVNGVLLIDYMYLSIYMMYQINNMYKYWLRIALQEQIVEVDCDQ